MTRRITETDILIDAPDKWSLQATLFEQDDSGNSPGIVVLISAAAAVPREFYHAYARHLVQRGANAAMTYDYRGMGGSAGDRARWPKLRMKDWALHDFPAAAHFLRGRYPQAKLVGVGHSYGGQALGLSGVSQLFERYGTVATMSGYWRDLDKPWSVYIQTRLVGAAIARTLGRIPKWAGLGEEMPGPIFLDWARWIRSPVYFFDDPDLPETARFTDVTLPFLSIGIQDDAWGTNKAISTFMANYKNAQMQQIWISPGESGMVGHLGFFRSRHKDTHWDVLTKFVLEG